MKRMIKEAIEWTRAILLVWFVFIILDWIIN